LWLLVDKMNISIDNTSETAFDLVSVLLAPDYIDLELSCSLDGSGDYRCVYDSSNDEFGVDTFVDVAGFWKSDREASVHWSVLYSCSGGGLTCVESMDDESYPCGGVVDGSFVAD
jgi:hypothetical protein